MRLFLETVAGTMVWQVMHHGLADYATSTTLRQGGARRAEVPDGCGLGDPPSTPDLPVTLSHDPSVTSLDFRKEGCVY
ncbi:hypothetical protein E2C01_061581 [Portunus trituberculatus]|uniref:Uncharacterized protein n=1 Tax=Portunus trituberculatus TaxID=210409 RepID=A0A5B7HBN1_PORTR|nr:hypothetical protein [Portunus trituberculatus]